MPTGSSFTVTAHTPAAAIPVGVVYPLGGPTISVNPSSGPPGTYFVFTPDFGAVPALSGDLSVAGPGGPAGAILWPGDNPIQYTVAGHYIASMYVLDDDLPSDEPSIIESPPVNFDVSSSAGLSVSGIVTSSVDDSAVQGVTITASSGPTATTGKDGTYKVSINSTNDTLTASLIGWTFFPTSALANVPNISFIGTPAGSTPNITSIAPQTFTPGQSEGTEYTIYGTSLSTVNGVVFLDSNGNPDPNLTFTADSTVGPQDTVVVGTISDAASVQAGSRALYVTTPNLGNSNHIGFAVQGDLSPFISTVSPATLVAGQPTAVTISGGNFGPACDSSGTPCTGAELDVCVSGVSSCTSSTATGDIAVTGISWSDAQITATFTAGSGITNGAYEVAVGSAGATGQGFFAPPSGKGKYSVPWKNIVVGGDPNLQLIVTSTVNSGVHQGVTTLTSPNSNGCAYVDENGNMPEITAVVSSANGGPPPTGTVVWQLSVYYPYTTYQPSPPFENPPVYAGRASALDQYDWPASPGQAANQPYTFPVPFNAVHIGWALLNYTYSAGSGGSAEDQPTFEFKICGTNPDANSVPPLPANGATMTALNNTGYWFAPNFALHETNMSQFCQQAGGRAAAAYCSDAKVDGLPVFGPPAGYGILQVDPAFVVGDAFSFQTNVDDWAGKVGTSGGASYWNGQVISWQSYNKDPQHTPVAAPAAISYPGCTFAMPADNSAGKPASGLSFGDAETIKEIAGIGYCFPDPSCPKAPANARPPTQVNTTLEFIRFQKDHLNAGDTPYWSVIPANTINNNIVMEICSCVGPTRSSCQSSGSPITLPEPPGCWAVDPNHQCKN